MAIKNHNKRGGSAPRRRPIAGPRAIGEEQVPADQLYEFQTTTVDEIKAKLLAAGLPVRTGYTKLAYWRRLRGLLNVDEYPLPPRLAYDYMRKRPRAGPPSRCESKMPIIQLHEFRTVTIRQLKRELRAFGIIPRQAMGKCDLWALVQLARQNVRNDDDSHASDADDEHDEHDEHDQPPAPVNAPGGHAPGAGRGGTRGRNPRRPRGPGHGVQKPAPKRAVRDRAAGMLLISYFDGPVSVLMQQRLDNSWGIPSSRLKDGEDSRLCAMRAAVEKTGLGLTQFELLDDEFASTADGLEYTTVYGELIDETFEPLASDKSVDLVWVPVEEVDLHGLHMPFAATWHGVKALIPPMSGWETS
ncbi:hypothetical protein JX266_000871 [Neoarthrinium moseri]|nr:hypothetical protein JX266_000871 [Neoarthrinium moseri]